MWTCRCGEENERQFAWCWKCGAARPPGAAAASAPAAAVPSETPAPGPSRLSPRHAPKAYVLWIGACGIVAYAMTPFTDADLWWLYVVGSPAAALLLVWFMTKGHHVPWRDALPLARPTAGALAATAALALGAAVVMGWVMDALYRVPVLARWFDSWPPNPADQDLAGFGWLKEGLAAVVSAPLAEEAVFRGVILTALLAGWRTRRAIVVTALLFALSHIHPLSVLNALVIGILVGWQRVVFGTLWLPVLTHAVFNAHVLAWQHAPWMPGWSAGTWLAVGTGLVLLGLDQSLRRRPPYSP